MFSATAIADFLACQHLTALNRAKEAGEIERPFFADPGLDLLIRLGLAHEQAYLKSLAEGHSLTETAGGRDAGGKGLRIVSIPADIPWKEAAARTVAAIRDGAEVIYQATFLQGTVLDDTWGGRADFLIRVDSPSALGMWSYEVVETKLARSTKARAIIQLCFYSDLLSTIQGVVPDYMHVVLGGGAQAEKFSVHRYLAYFRKVRREFESAYQAKAATYPEPVEHCRVCTWSSVCDRRWHDDDHLSLVAGITGNQRKTLVENRITTVAQLGGFGLPSIHDGQSEIEGLGDQPRLNFGEQQPKIEGIGAQALHTIREQARLQVQGRAQGHHIYELLAAETDKGLSSLPLPSPGDVFLDFEGDPFASDQGLEYLFGTVTYRNYEREVGGGRPMIEEASDESPRQAKACRTLDSEVNYEAVWALDRAEEKKAFESFIAMVMERRRQYPDMHIYHYGAYEETAIKRMAGQHATCVEEVDQVLRANVLVDLFRVVKQGLRASVESYSIKKLEDLYEFKREVKLVDANLALTTFSAVLAFGPGELGARSAGGSPPLNTGDRGRGLGELGERSASLFEDVGDVRRAIEGYNRDDCVSTLRLRDWLEEKRRELEASSGAQLPRPVQSESGEPGEDLSAYLERVRAVAERLTGDLPADETEWTDEQRGRWLMAQLLEWHRREDKSAWWEYYRLCELSDQELLEDKSALGGLVYLGPVETVKKSIVHRYRFPLQDHAIDRARNVHDPRTQDAAGTVVAIDERGLTIDIKRGASSKVPHPTALIPHNIIDAKVLRESLLRLGAWVADNGIDGGALTGQVDNHRDPPAIAGGTDLHSPDAEGGTELGPPATAGGSDRHPPATAGGTDRAFQAARDLLLRKAPRLRGNTLRDLVASGQQSIEVAKQVALALDHTVLPIQGPPGSGKTYTGAQMVVELVRKGLQVGVTAVSHKVISKLLEDTCAAAREAGVKLKGTQKVDGGDGCVDEIVTRAKDNEAVVNALRNHEAHLAAGTVWLWARPEMADIVDVLFVDEAGQMSLANVLAASQAAKSVVLLGDPQQLDQPQRGVHPPGAEASALAHLLHGRATIGADQGLFLAESWRLHPDVCAFTSEVFYDNRLASRPENARQRLNAQGPFDGTGLRFAPVNHSGNQSESPEEAQKALEIVEQLLQGGATWTNKKGETVPLLLKHILIVAPYNAQVSALLQRLPRGARVGTVDKFQGQEAPVVLYSMATSTPQDAPRGMEFLYSSNRLNVATSRAQCVTVLIANPGLFEVQCKTPRQIELANAFCRYLEMARVV